MARIVIPEKLCERIEKAIDEESLVKRQRLEELETVELGKIVRRVEGQDVEEDNVKAKKKEELKKEKEALKKLVSRILNCFTNNQKACILRYASTPRPQAGPFGLGTQTTSEH